MQLNKITFVLIISIWLVLHRTYKYLIKTLETNFVQIMSNGGKNFISL